MARNTTGLKKTLEAMQTAGQLEDVDAAVIALAEGLAAAVDDDPANGALWREYRAALTALREAGDAGGDDDDTAAFRFSIQAPRGASLVNTSQP